MNSKILLIILVIISISCSHSETNYEKMIHYVRQDSALADSLMYTGYPEDKEKIKADNFEYSVHSLINSSMLDYQNSSCIKNLNDSETVINQLTSSLDIVDKNIRKYSSSDLANVHFFFTSTVSNVKGLTVFYRNPNSFNYNYDLLYSKPLDFIWRYNRGLFYLFIFNKDTGEIIDVCKEIVLNE